MKDSKYKLFWVAMSVCGFVTTFHTGRQLYNSGVRLTTVLAYLGLVIAALGAFGLIYASFFLQSSVFRRQRGEFTTRGIYHVVRHPLYLSGIVLNLGIMLMGVSTYGFGNIQHLIRADYYLIFHGAGIVFFWLAARIEDHYNVVKFGEAYRQYVVEVPRLNPVKGWRQLKARKNLN